MGHALANERVVGFYREALASLLLDALRDGVVLAVEVRPLPPLAMGHYELIPHARPVWVNAQ